MLHQNAKVELLRRIPFFSACSKSDLERIALLADEIDFPAGKALMTEGRPGYECFVIIEGRVQMTRGNRAVAARGGSELFGEIALLTNEPRTATVTTATPTRALVLTARDFRDLVKSMPSIGLKVMKSLADRLQSLEPDAEAEA